MKRIIWIFISILFLLVTVILSQLNQSGDGYEQEIKKYWEDKHNFFRTSEASPFVQKKIEYQEVDMFPTDPSYKVSAILERFTKREIVTVGNSDGTNTNYLKFAIAKFKIDGQQQSILILRALGFGNQYLIAFGDETSGETTYGGGRYLDLEIGKSDRITIDFNKAYNPYCAYFADFTCPLPPLENLLTVAIEAGEKVYPWQQTPEGLWLRERVSIGD
ncbi:MAG: DUF1684 domain-containing protein [Bacteroidota bacterium]